MARAKEAPFEEMDDDHRAQLSRNRVVKAPIGRVEKLQSKGQGRPRKYSPTQVLRRTNNYFKWCEKNDRVPSIKGLMMHLKLDRMMWYRYMDEPDFMPIMEGARMVMEEWVANDIYQTPGQAAGKIAYAKNLHGWAEKVDTTSVNENRNITVLSVEDAKTKIASLAHLIDPALLEALSGNYVKKQLVHTVEVENG
jgi:hypothetical protein